MSKHREAHLLRAALTIAVVAAATFALPAAAVDAAVPPPDDPSCTDTYTTPAATGNAVVSDDGWTVIDEGEVDGLTYTWDMATGDGTPLLSRPGQPIPLGVEAVDISADGRFVLVASDHASFVDPPWNGGVGPIPTQLYRWDRLTATAEHATPGIGGAAADFPTFARYGSGTVPPLHAWLSDDGEQVVFETFASNLVPEVTAPLSIQVYRRDLNTDTTTLITKSPEGAPGDGSSHVSSVGGGSLDHLAIATRATNLGGDVSGCLLDAYLTSTPFDHLTRLDPPDGVDPTGVQQTATDLSDDGQRLLLGDLVYDVPSDAFLTVGFPDALDLVGTVSELNLVPDGESVAYRGSYTASAGLARASGYYVHHLDSDAITAIDLDLYPDPYDHLWYDASSSFVVIESGGVWLAEDPTLGTAAAPALLTPIIESKGGRFGTVCTTCHFHDVSKDGSVLLMTGDVSYLTPRWWAGADLTGYLRDRRTVFADVEPAKQFEAEIRWLADEGLSTGFSDGTFHPAQPLTRQAMAAFLYRYAGSPLGDDPTCATAPAVDVATDNPFCGEIAWLLDEGLATAGIPFRPLEPISRQAMAAFLWRMAGEPAGPFPDPGFTDVPADHPFVDEIAWMAANDIADGYADGGFHPTSPVSRQATAAFLSRFQGLAEG